MKKKESHVSSLRLRQMRKPAGLLVLVLALLGSHAALARQRPEASLSAMSSEAKVSAVIMTAGRVAGSAGSHASQAPLPGKSLISNSSDPMPMMPMPSVAPLFLESAAFSSVLNLVNELKSPMKATVELYTIDGDKISYTTVEMKPYSLKEINLRTLISASAQPVEIGSLRVKADHTAGLLAALAITHRGSPTTYIDEELSMPTVDGSSALRGVAVDFAGSQTITAITSLASSSLQHLTVTCLPEQENSRQQVFELSANQTILIRPCFDGLSQRLSSISEIEQQEDLTHTRRSSSQAAGISIVSDGMPGEFAAYGLTLHHDRMQTFFTSINFSDPRTKQSKGFVYAGIPVGPSPILTAGDYKPQISLTNFGFKPAAIKMSMASTIDGVADTQIGAPLSLPARTTRTITLSRMPVNPSLTSSLLVETDATAGDVVSKLTARSEGQMPVVEILDKEQELASNAGGHPWSVEPGTTSTLILFNHDFTSQLANLRFGTRTGIWMKRYQLKSMETIAVSVNDLIRNRAVDDSGKPLLIDQQSGELGWQADSSLVTGRLLQADVASGMARNFSCNQWTYACSFAFAPSPTLQLFLNNTSALGESPEWALFTGFAPPSSCSCANSTSANASLTYSWSSGNSSIASIVSGNTSSSSTWNGAGAGSTTANLAGTNHFSGNVNLTCQAAEPAAVSACTATVSSPVNGQVFSLNAGNYNQTSISLNAQSSCAGGNASWSFSWTYTSGNGNQYSGSDLTTTTAGTAKAFSPTVGNGGNAAITMSVNGGSPATWSVYVNGTSIPNSTIDIQLEALYASGARPHLLTGIAQVESSYMPFKSRTQYAVTGYWPNESYDGGSHVGLMQVPMSMANAFDWTANMRAGSTLFNQKLVVAQNYSNSQVQSHPGLPALSATQLENDALVFYGPYGSSGHYYVVSGTSWVVNPNNSAGVNYANSVVASMH